MRKAIDPVEALWALVRQHGTITATAKHLGYSTPYLSDVLRSRRGMTDKMLKQLGLVRVVVRVD